MSNVKPEDKKEYFEQATNWDKRQFSDAITAKNTYKKIAWVGAIFGLVGCMSTFFLLPLKTFVPTVIRVDTTTGDYDVDRQGQHLDIKDKRNEKIMVRDLITYVGAKEGFTRGEAQKNYNIAYLMSCGTVRADVEKYFLVEKNPASPLITMQIEDKDEVKIINQVFLPTDKDNLKVAQVRFDKVISRGGIAKSKTRYLATIAYDYDETNVPSGLSDYAVNPFGFCARNYRVDQEGQTVLLSAGLKAENAEAGAK